jgi:hypothetical protein
MTGANPFLGARPYGPADDKLFFGRKAAAARLVERIDLHPLTILTSPSGLGKTSLLRAAVLPELERIGLSPVYVTPDPTPAAGEDAAGALLDGRLAESIAAALLVDPELEVKCLRRLRHLASRNATLAEARKWFAGLTALNPTRVKILSPPERGVERLAMTARFLRGSLAPEAIAAQLGSIDARVAQLFDLQTPVRLLRKRFPDATFTMKAAEAYRAVLDASKMSCSGADNIEGSLVQLCGTANRRDALLARTDGDLDLCAEVVLLIDQFEQIFTLGRAETRARMLHMLGDLLSTKAPIHVVLSLRKEWYADLIQQFSPHLRLTDPLERNTFYLEPMTRREAEEVMVEAPGEVGANGIEPSQREALWQALQHDETIDAVVLSVACHELFARGEAAQSAINEAGVEGLLRAYLSRALDAIRDDTERDEAFDILGEIAGVGTTRNFVTHNSLVNAPLRDRERRMRVLDALQKAFLVKGDNPRRGFDKVYDVMHERLLVPLRELIATRPELAAFREAAERIAQEDAWERGLNWRHCRALLAGGRRVVWNSRAAGILVSSLIRELDRDRLADLWQSEGDRDPSVPQGTTPLHWLRDKLCELAAASAQRPDLAAVSATDRNRLSWWMTEEEIAARVDAPPDAVADALALQSGLQGPAGRMRRELVGLAERLSEIYAKK